MDKFTVIDEVMEKKSKFDDLKAEMKRKAKEHQTR
jgi:hypothetical protein